MTDERYYEVEFQGGEITVSAVMSVPDIGQDDRDPVREELINYSYSDLPVSELRIDGIREFASGTTGSNSIVMRVDDVQLTAADETGDAE